jgi:hypothetical protein
MTRALAWAYLGLAYAFILLPVAALVLFSFQDGPAAGAAVPGLSLRWYADILGDRDLMAALCNSALVARARRSWPARWASSRPTASPATSCRGPRWCGRSSCCRSR